MSKDVHDNSLHWLAEEVTRSIFDNKDGTDQRHQVEKLMALEEKFRKSIKPYAQSREIYKKFILAVAVTNKNILSARPYFREKAGTFSSSITPAIKAGDIKALQEFHINYNLMQFIRENWLGPFPKRSQKLFDETKDIRRRLIENNIPLAINRAKLFFRKVPRSHLTLMDMIGIASMGLVSGVDKYVGEYTRVFNGVCIGRMTGNMIDSYSETTLHFYPSDRSILYRANSLRYRLKIDDLAVLADAINKSYVEDAKTGMRVPKGNITTSQLSELMGAASPVSSDGSDQSSGANDERGQDNSVIDVKGMHDDKPNAEDMAIHNDAVSRMILCARRLPLLQQKILRLKGIKV
jgi:hypothetical protein